MDELQGVTVFAEEVSGNIRWLEAADEHSAGVEYQHTVVRLIA